MDERRKEKHRSSHSSDISYTYSMSKKHAGLGGLIPIRRDRKERRGWPYQTNATYGGAQLRQLMDPADR